MYANSKEGIGVNPLSVSHSCHENLWEEAGFQHAPSSPLFHGSTPTFFPCERSCRMKLDKDKYILQHIHNHLTSKIQHHNPNDEDDLGKLTPR